MLLRPLKPRVQYLSQNNENLESKNAYDIQKVCIDTASVSIEKLFDNKDIEEIKIFAFNNGNPNQNND